MTRRPLNLNSVESKPPGPPRPAGRHRDRDCDCDAGGRAGGPGGAARLRLPPPLSASDSESARAPGPAKGNPCLSGDNRPAARLTCNLKAPGEAEPSQSGFPSRCFPRPLAFPWMESLRVSREAFCTLWARDGRGLPDQIRHLVPRIRLGRGPPGPGGGAGSDSDCGPPGGPAAGPAGSRVTGMGAASEQYSGLVPACVPRQLKLI